MYKVNKTDNWAMQTVPAEYQEPNRQVLEDISKYFQHLMPHFYKKIEKIPNISLCNRISIVFSFQLTFNDKLDAAKFFILYYLILSIIVLSEYVSVVILSMYSDINCLPVSSSDKRFSFIEHQGVDQIQYYKALKCPWNGLRKVFFRSIFYHYTWLSNFRALYIPLVESLLFVYVFRRDWNF